MSETENPTPTVQIEVAYKPDGSCNFHLAGCKAAKRGFGGMTPDISNLAWTMAELDEFLTNPDEGEVQIHNCLTKVGVRKQVVQ